MFLIVLAFGFLSTPLAVEGQCADSGSDERFPYFVSTPVSYLNVRMRDRIWAPRQRLVHDVTLPWATQAHDSAGGLEAFRANPQDYASRTRLGEMEHIKCIEAMAYVAGIQPDPAINGLITAWVRPLLEAQGPDGYLFTEYPQGTNRFSNRWWSYVLSHEDYTIGHYLEAAIAVREATGDGTMYQSAIRAVDNMADELLGNKHAYTSGHPEIEQALMRLYGTTGNKRYLELCGWLLDHRGRHDQRVSYGRYAQDDVPVSEQREIWGHAVRAAYLYNGVTQYIGATDNNAYRAAVLAVWRDLEEHKLYLHGGTGSVFSRIEGYSEPFELRPDDVYGESCAVWADFQWAQSLARLTGDAHYLDVAERLLYNAFLAALAVKGDCSFYCNVAESDPLDQGGGSFTFPITRSGRLAVSCCPPNIIKLIATVGGYFYSTDPDGIFVNHYGASETQIPWATGIKISQETNYPWDGHISVVVSPEQATTFTLRLRFPAWAQSFALSVNGEAVKLDPKCGWIALRREWHSGDRIELNLPMPVRRITKPPSFRAYRNRVALQRGPIVYCLEAGDVIKPGPPPQTLSTFFIPDDALPKAEFRPDFLGGVTVLAGEVHEPIGEFEYEGERVWPAIFVPYGVWGNRTTGAMRIWLASERAPRAELSGPQIFERP